MQRYFSRICSPGPPVASAGSHLRRRASGRAFLALISKVADRKGATLAQIALVWLRGGHECHLLSDLATPKNATPAQVALAWLLAQKLWIVPIPGTRKMQRLEENLGAVAIELTPDDLREIDAAAPKIELQGARGTGHEKYV